MAIPSGYARFMIKGTLNGGDIFEWGFWNAGAPTTAAAATAAATAVATALGVTSTGTTPWGLISSGEHYDEVRCYSYPAGGPTATYVGSAPASHTGGGSGSAPNQVALCVTTLTGLSGRRNRGRIYLPCTAPGTLTSGQRSSTNTDSVVTWLVDFFHAVNSGIGQPCVVLSQVAGSANNITAVRVDSKLDVQRRRANRQVTTYTKLATL